MTGHKMNQPSTIKSQMIAALMRYTAYRREATVSPGLQGVAKFTRNYVRYLRKSVSL